MAVAGIPDGPLRVGRCESSRLAWAFALSLSLHLCAGGGYYAGKKFGWWQNIHWPAWLQSARMLTEVLKKKETQQPSETPQMPLMFLDVSPAQASVEPPKDAKFYSDKNSRAANVDTTMESSVPKITGKQTQVVATEDIPREKFVPLQPSRAEPAKAPQEELKAKPKEAPGDLALAKPDPNPKPDSGKAERPRARTVEQLLAQNPGLKLPSEKMKQDGGVKRRDPQMVSLDAVATPFGAYDAAVVEAIKAR